mgnify:CR=1 FL=1
MRNAQQLARQFLKGAKAMAHSPEGKFHEMTGWMPPQSHPFIHVSFYGHKRPGNYTHKKKLLVMELNATPFSGVNRSS